MKVRKGNIQKNHLLKRILIITLALYIYSGKSVFFINGNPIQSRFIFLGILFIPVFFYFITEITSQSLKFKLSHIAIFSLLFAIFIQVVLYGNKLTKNEYIVNIGCLIFLNLALYILIKSYNEFTVLLYSFYALGIILLSLAVIGFNDPSGNLDFWNTKRNFERFSAIATTTIFAKLMCLSSVATLTIASGQKSRKYAIVFHIFSFIFVIAAFMSKSLAVVLAYFFSIAFVSVLLLALKRFSDVKKFLLISIIVGVIGLSFTGSVLNAKFQQRVQTSPSASSSVSVEDKSSLEASSSVLVEDKSSLELIQDKSKLVLIDNSQRLSLMNHAIQLFSQKKVFGVGWGNYKYFGLVNLYPPELGYYSYPHNVLLEFLSMSGFLGFIFFSFASLVIFLQVYWNLEVIRGSKFFALFIVGVFFASNFGGDYYDFLFLISVGVFLNNFSTANNLQFKSVRPQIPLRNRSAQ